MSRRSNFEELLNLVQQCKDESDFDYNYDDLIDFIHSEVATLDVRAAKARDKNAARADDLTERVREALTEDYSTIDDVVDALNDPDITRGKVKYRLNKMAEMGEICKATVVVDADENGRNVRTAIAYCLREKE